MRGVNFNFYKIVFLFQFLSVLIFFIINYKSHPLFLFSAFILIYTYIIFVKDKSSKIKKFQRLFKNYMVYLKNRFRNKFKKNWKKSVVFFNIYANKLFTILKNFSKAIRDTKKIDRFLTRIHLRFLMRVVWFYVGFVNYSIILNYKKYFKKSVDNFVEFCKSRAFLFNVKKYKFIYLIILVIPTLIVIIKLSNMLYLNIQEIFNNFIFYDKILIKEDTKKMILEKENIKRLFLIKFKYKLYENYRFLKFIDYSFLMHLIENNIYKGIWYKKNINSNLISLKFNDNNMYTNVKCEKVYSKLYYIDHFLLKFYEIKGSKGYRNYYDKSSKSFKNSLTEIMFGVANKKKNISNEPLLKNEAISYSDFDSKARLAFPSWRERKLTLTDHLFNAYFEIKSLFRVEKYTRRDSRSGFIYGFIIANQSSNFTLISTKNNYSLFIKELFKFDEPASKLVKFHYFWKQHTNLIKKFRFWNEDVRHDSVYYKLRRKRWGQSRHRHINYSKYNLKNLYRRDTFFTDVPFFRSKNSTFRYRQYRKFFEYKSAVKAASGFFSETRKFEQLHLYKKLGVFKSSSIKYFLTNQYYYYCVDKKKRVETDLLDDFFRNFSFNRYNMIKTNFFFENKGRLLNEKNACNDEFNYAITLKKIEQSKKLASFFYKFKDSFNPNVKYKDLSKSFLYLSFGGTCLDNFKNKNKVDYFLAEPPAIKRPKGTYFQIVIARIQDYSFAVFIFILSIPGKVFTFFTEQIPYRAIFLYFWWLIKGVFNFKHFDNYIYGPEKRKPSKPDKRYFIEALYLRRELKNNIDMTIVSETPHLAFPFKRGSWVNLNRKCASQFSWNEYKFSSALHKYHTHYFRGQEKLGEDCFLKTPRAHKEKISNGHFYVRGKRRRSLLYCQIKGINYETRPYIDVHLRKEVRENKRTIRRLNRRMDTLNKKIDLKKKKTKI